MIYVVTLLVQLVRELNPDDAAQLAREWAERSGVDLDATMTGTGVYGDEPVLRVAGRIEAAGPMLAERVDELGDVLHEHGVEVAAWHEVSIVSLAEHDRQAAALSRVIAASAS